MGKRWNFLRVPDEEDGLGAALLAVALLIVDEDEGDKEE